MAIVKRVLTDPITIILGVIGGFVVGLFFKGLAPYLQPLASLYISLMSMCLLPIMVTALIWGIAQMLRNPNTRYLFGRMAAIYAIGFLVPCGLAIVVTTFFQPGGDLPPEAAAALGGLLAEGGDGGGQGGLLTFVASIIPPNVFDALSQGKFVSIVFFCALVGLALGAVESKTADAALDVVNAFYGTFSLLFSWILLPLPIGLFCIVGASIAQADHGLLLALLDYVLYFYVTAALILAVYFASISVAARMAPWTALAGLKSPLVLALATDNPFVALYSAIEALQERFRVGRELANTIVPFGVLANQHGQVLLFTFTAIFLAQVYDVELGMGGLATIAIGCILAGAAAVGGGPVLAPIIAPVLIGAGIPDALALVVLTTAQPAVAPVSSTVTVAATCTLAIMTGRGVPAADPGLTERAADETVVATRGVL